MARRSSFGGLINAMARDAARLQRQAEAERKRQARAIVTAARYNERASKLQAKEDKLRYLEARIEEAEDQNTELAERIEELRAVLEHTFP